MTSVAVEPPSEAALWCAGISHGYFVSRGVLGRRAAEPVLQEVSLTVPRGHCVALVGESGSGKSTLTRILLGIERPTVGQVFLDGLDLHAMPARARARRIQPVFQNPAASLNPALTVRQIILRPLMIHRLGDAKEQTAALHEMLEKVGIGRELQDIRSGELSGGQQQRVALARALMLKPGLLILDEPTSSLDVSVQALILHVLRNLQRELGLTYLFVTHNFPVVAAIADDVAVMSRGRIVESGACENVLSSPAHPETKRLISASLSLDVLRNQGPVQNG